MEKRLCGREQEFGFRVALRSGNNFYIETSKAEKFKSDILDKIIKSAGKVTAAVSFDEESYYWLGNGALIYPDLDSVVEVSTAEHLAGSYDGIAQEKALEIILNKAVKLVLGEKTSFGKIDSIALYKNNVYINDLNNYDDIVTYGSHHNYSYATKERNRIFDLMRNFIPASLPITGNGHILKLASGKFVYALSQRAEYIEAVKNHSTTDCRSIINLRNEPLMDPESKMSRLHLISRDATRCEYQTWLVDTLTHLVLRLAEEGWHLPKRLVLNQPLKEMHNLNLRIDLNYCLKTASCRLNVVDYNYLFLNAAKQLRPLSFREKLGIQEWEKVLGLLRAKAFSRLRGKLDWVTKLCLLEDRLKKKYISGLDDIRALKINRGYHDISVDPKQSWFALLDEAGWIKHLVGKPEIRRAMTVAPATRARSRGNFIKSCLKNSELRKSVKNLNWETAETADAIVRFGYPDNPFSTDTFFEPLDFYEAYTAGRRMLRSFPGGH